MTLVTKSSQDDQFLVKAFINVFFVAGSSVFAVHFMAYGNGIRKRTLRLKAYGLLLKVGTDILEIVERWLLGRQVSC